MPFRDHSAMDQKEEFVRLASVEGANVSALCLRFGIGRTCGHKLLARYRSGGSAGLQPQSRRPHASPTRSQPEVEAAVVSLRKEHPAWGGRKIAKVLSRRGVGELAPSTVTNILRRHGIELGALGGGAKPFMRFEHAAPNDLWQMDFKGHVPLQCSGRLHPLTVLDDHSRFSVALQACPDQTFETVRNCLIAAFGRYGLPWRIAADNGPPWGDGGSGNGYTMLTVWLIEHEVAVSHSRPYHPQTLGKDERFHRTLKGEVMRQPPFRDIAVAQRAFDAWRDVYNTQRPHDGLDGAVPLDRYRPSLRDFSNTIQPFDYGEGQLVRKVQSNGVVSLLGRLLSVGTAFTGKSVAFRPTERDGVFTAFFRHQAIKTVDINANPS